MAVHNHVDDGMSLRADCPACRKLRQSLHEMIGYAEKFPNSELAALLTKLRLINTVKTERR